MVKTLHVLSAIGMPLQTVGHPEEASFVLELTDRLRFLTLLQFGGFLREHRLPHWQFDTSHRFVGCCWWFQVLQEFADQQCVHLQQPFLRLGLGHPLYCLSPLGQCGRGTSSSTRGVVDGCSIAGKCIKCGDPQQGWTK